MDMQVYTKYDLQKHNTMGIAATAATFLVLEKIDEIPHALEHYGAPAYVLGGGSNIVLSNNLEGVTRHITSSAITSKEDGDTILLTCDAGCIRDSVVRHSVDNNRWGIENLIAIPGSIGAAPVQNIGAYGVEFKDVCETVEVYDLQEKIYKTLSVEECTFSYRMSVFKELPGRYIVCRTTIRLSTTPHPKITYKALVDALATNANPTQKEIADTIERVRRSKLPRPGELGSVGSFFQNPIVSETQVQELLVAFPNMPHFPYLPGQEKLPAARLIDQAGCKGVRHGAVGSYELQPLVIVQYGGATGQDIVNYAQFIIKSVEEKFHIQLVPEANIW